ncbi:F-type H+-transporting ATPase subunit b [Dietzia sp. 2505]|jgi:F-type H+-transporting ATPase subunit b|uniref:F0F1 ATP synthase subunit B n=1 Tax=Dietzia TaxID=37914 RepID=UPI0015C78EA3|nr:MULTISPECIES: F0F1 ATP synthase subunit B [unclassified Dietzia]MBB1030584.1 F0F1 ATP synthase subunit B [Dietzia sp. SLG310A2-38A2]MBB1034421.1 F0F1 ATP synthase subunit B [Dietzia sp. CQ4]MBB1041306.1 F0F1 ATP synthase subunit B [Dietzia sp. Cai40]MBB1044509.1 F0F1 ATP synthase subunit B [Dietzia sp. DQ11-44]MBB1053338.1 F0F1 ATP synthase subunit B [Dietzia sp. B44]
MNNVIAILAAEGGESLPLEDSPNPLIPPLYDIVWSLIPLAVILWLFWKFILPKFQQVLDERSERIEGGLRRAEQTQAEAKEELAKYKAQLAEARSEAAKIRDDARAQGQQILADMKTEAQAESDRIVAAGNQQLAAQRQQIIAELRSDLGRQSVDLAERLMGEQLSDPVRRSGTIDRFLADLDRVPGAGKN